MTGVNTQCSPDTLEAGIAHLRASKDAHLELVRQAMAADDALLFAPDLVMWGVAQRSLQLISGFALMVEHSNAVCAVPLIRLQLDNVMRFYALWLVPDYNSVLEALLSDMPLGKVKSRDGQALSDTYLVEQLSKLHPWVTEVYKRTSGFVHLSSPGVLSVVTSAGNGEHTAQMAIGSDSGRRWRDDEKKESLDAFIAVTDALLHLFGSWLYTKDTVLSPKSATMSSE